MKNFLLLLLVNLIFVFAYAEPASGNTKKEDGERVPFTYETGNTSLKFGGFVRFVTFADYKGTVPSYDFINSTMSNEWDKLSRLSMDASATRLNMKVVQKTDLLGKVEFFVEMDFRGASDVLRLRHAYLSFKGFTFGQTWSNMVDLAANAPTIDVQGVNSRTFYRVPLIGYKSNFTDKVSMGISFEFPKVKMTTSAQVGSVNQRFPDIPLYLMLKGERAHLKVTGLLRAMDYGDNPTQKIKTMYGIGGQVSGSLNFCNRVTLMGQGIYGKGIARYINDLAALNLDLIYNDSDNTVHALPMFGVSVAARANFNKSLYATSSFSVASLTNKKEYYSDNEFFRGNYFSASLFWIGVKNLTIAGEFIHGRRINMNSIEKSANRIQLMFMYSW